MDDEDDDEEFEQGTNKNFGASTRMKKPISHRGVYSYVIFCTLVHVLTMCFFNRDRKDASSWIHF